jgi:uncharacterized membrane protein
MGLPYFQKTMKKEVKTARILMVVSGLMGATFFILANIAHLFVGLNLLAGIIQICINAFVFLSWKRGYETHTGKAKTVALIGTIVPCIMASITLIRVILPEILKSLPQ